MVGLRQRPVFLFLVVLLFAIGHSHQVLGRFQSHNHDMEVVAHEHQDSDSDEHRHDGDEHKDAEHMAEHATFAAVVPALFVPATIELRLLAPVNVAPLRAVEPRASGIDHPPQLIG